MEGRIILVKFDGNEKKGVKSIIRLLVMQLLAKGFVPSLFADII